MSDDEVRVERRGCAVFATLNRPKALNALTLDMVRSLAAILDEFEADPSVQRIVVQGAGDRAFCAGGDIRWLYERGRAGDYEAQLAFWREEYALNVRIKRFSKPYVALIDGIVMGGGVGVSLHGSHRVVTERATFAMPEVGIGFFPDVGATWAMPRAPHRIGVAMAATGLRANGADMVALNLADYFVDARALNGAARALEAPGKTNEILQGFSVPPPNSPLSANAAFFERAFAACDRDQIETALREDGSELAQRLLGMMAKASPISLAVALRQMEVGPKLDFEAAMRLELAIVTRIAQGHDFYEGVRATLVDKDGQPHWATLPGCRPDPAEIRPYFASIDGEKAQ